MNLDDCWGEKNRSAAGLLQASALFVLLQYARLTDARSDAERFPSGFNNLTDQLHEMGLCVSCRIVMFVNHGKSTEKLSAYSKAGIVRVPRCTAS